MLAPVVHTKKRNSQKSILGQSLRRDTETSLNLSIDRMVPL